MNYALAYGDFVCYPLLLQPANGIILIFTRVKKALLEEQYKRSKAEENEAKAILQCQLMKAEMEKLRKQISEQANQTKSSVASSFTMVRAARL